MAGPEANSTGDDGVLLRLPPVRGIGAGRVITGLVLAVLLPPGIELMVTVLGFRNFAMIMLLQLAVAVAVAAIGGLWPAVVAAVSDGAVHRVEQHPPTAPRSELPPAL